MKMFRVLSVFVFMMFAANAAANWRLPKLGKKKPKRIEALVVTGNFVESRVLAELIQQRLEQPMLLLPTGSEDDRCYYVPPSGQSLEVDDGDFLEFVRFLRPKKVLFLGSERYAPQAFHDKLIGAEIPTWAINNEDWGQIAASTEDLLQVKNLHLDYLVLIEQVDADGRIVSPVNHTIFGEYVVGDGRQGKEWIDRRKKLEAQAVDAAAAKAKAEAEAAAKAAPAPQTGPTYQANAHAPPLPSASRVSPAHRPSPRIHRHRNAKRSRMFWDSK